MPVVSERESQVWQEVSGYLTSPSHGVLHIERVQEYVEELCKLLEIDSENARIAAILHDLGRGDDTRKHGLESLKASREISEEILSRVNLPSEDKQEILEAIETHDQPDVSPPTQIGKVLKDADFLAGFGAWGALRIAMWSGETGREIDEARRKIRDGMVRRAESLEFAASREAVFREILFAKLFDAELSRPARLGKKEYPGFYIVLEGISGAGKNTIAEEIISRMSNRGHTCLLIEEPGEEYRRLKEKYSKDLDGSLEVQLTRSLLMVDRVAQIKNEVIPALERGEMVVSVRSYLSTAVYQSEDLASSYLTMLHYDWVPTADILLLFDLNAATALDRIEKREKSPGNFENLDHLEKHRDVYTKLSKAFPARTHLTIDAERSETQVADNVMHCIDEVF